MHSYGYTSLHRRANVLTRLLDLRTGHWLRMELEAMPTKTVPPG
ncbi:MAG TPA: hypothetical protein VK324_04990 [Tepidisphaeraceae bacterium]|nr:hypothetical protein [Tepidisphaeraceae bacterium]